MCTKSSIRPAVHRVLRERLGAFFMIAVAASALGLVATANAAAVDNASMPAYNSGWTNNSNGGTGFQPWSLVPFTYNQTDPSGPTAGFLIQSSSTAYGTTATPNIDTYPNGIGGIGVQGASFAIYANNADANGSNLLADPAAYRPFTNAMGVGDTFSMNVLTPALNQANSQVGFELQDVINGVATPVFNFYSLGSATTYGINYGPNLANFIDTGLSTNNANGINVALTLTGPTTASVVLTPLDAELPKTFANLSLGTGTAINQAMLYNDNLSYTGSQYTYYNSLSVSGAAVPEPTTLAILVVGLLVATGLRRRRADPAV